MSRDTALVLAAHGATDDPRCAAPVERHAETIRAQRRFASVHTIYWKQRPFFSDLYDVTNAEELLIVPVMMASGYYTNTVLPREIQFDAPPPGRSVRIARPIGELDEMADLIVDQAQRALATAELESSSAHLLVIGHGTWRDPVRSSATTYRHANTVRDRALFRSVRVGFLEQNPTVAGAFAMIPKDEPVIIVPYLIASGGHGSDDIPVEIGVTPGSRAAMLADRIVLFAEAVGEHPHTAQLILDTAQLALREAEECVG